MASARQRPVLYFDFDNTITLGDVLDTVIERFSVTTNWREWEAAWQEGRMTTSECLARQMGDLRVSSVELLRFVSTVAIDPAFTEIVTFAARNEVELTIVSDNFSPLIHEILRSNGLSAIPVLANELTFRGDVVEAHFPLRDSLCLRCAHCKAQHLRRILDRTRIYIGDGLSDVCPALVADVLFAKDSLAAEMTRRGLPFLPFRMLSDVKKFLHDEYDSPSAR